MKNISIVHQMKTNIITQNGNINIGSTVQNNHTSNLKAAGASFTFGDCSNIIEPKKQALAIAGKSGQNDGSESGQNGTAAEMQSTGNVGTQNKS